MTRRSGLTLVELLVVFAIFGVLLALTTRVQPQDLTATIFHCLGYEPHTEMRDTLGRPLVISRGEVVRQAV